MSNPEPRQLMKTICSPKNQTCRAAIPAPNFFPNDFKPLANACHAAGVKFGIHMMRGIPRAAVEANTPIEGSSVRARDIADALVERVQPSDARRNQRCHHDPPFAQRDGRLRRWLVRCSGRL